MASLRVRLPLLISTVITAVVVTLLWAEYREFEQQLLTAGGERAAAAANQVAGLLEGMAQQSIDNLRRIAKDPVLATYVQQPTDQNRLLAHERLGPIAATGSRRIELWNAAGDRLLEISGPSPAAGDQRVELPPSPRPATPGVGPLNMTGNVVFSDLVGELLAEQGPDRKTNPQRLGHLVVRSPLVASPPGIFSRLVGTEAVILIGNQSGEGWTDLTQPVAAPAVDLARDGVGEYRSAHGHVSLGAITLVRGTPWAVWVGFPRALIMAPASRLVRRMLIIGPIFVAMGALLAAIVSVRITRPLRELADAADAISGGDLARRVAITRSDEIGRLAQAFNSMVEIRLKTLAVEEENRRVLEASRLKSEFVANMSHELRTPLNVIIGFAELMHQGKVGPVSPGHREYLADILTSSTHLLHLINDVLDLAKVESGTMELYPEPVDLPQLIVEVRDILRELAAGKRLQVQTEVDPAVATVTVDQARLKQILFNYLSNAIKFAPEESTVIIRVLPEDNGFFRIDVEDSGMGIAEEDIGKLFIEFQQLESRTAKRHQGTGLGLALSKRLAEALGGRVGVTSTLGVGSTFAVVLPRSAESH